MHRQWQFTVLCETKPCVIQEIGPVQILHLVFVELDYLPFWCWLAQVNLGSLHFNGHFPGGPGLAGTRMSPLWILLKQRMMEVVVTTGTIRRTKLQPNHHHQQTNTQCFICRMPFCHPINSVKVLKGNGLIWTKGR